jgi:hypothetical protein
MDSSSPTTDSTPTFNPRYNKLNQLRQQLSVKYQILEDRIVPFKLSRWGAFAFALFLYFLRVFVFVGGFYIVTYTLSIHLLYCLVVLITPLADPEGEDDGLDGASLPASGFASRNNNNGGDDASEHKPFIPKVAEFKVWRSMFRVVVIAIFITFFPIFDLPVFWPILLLYFVMLFVTQMAGRIQHMLRHKYVPWNANKPKFVAKDEK